MARPNQIFEIQAQASFKAELGPILSWMLRKRQTFWLDLANLSAEIVLHSEFGLTVDSSFVVLGFCDIILPHLTQCWFLN